VEGEVGKEVGGKLAVDVQSTGREKGTEERTLRGVNMKRIKRASFVGRSNVGRQEKKKKARGWWWENRPYERNGIRAIGKTGF